MSFAVSGSASLAAQGGSTTGCGVPAAANSITTTVIATGAAGSGYLVGYATGSTPPATSFLNFIKGTTSSAAVLPIASSGTKQLSIEAAGSETDVVVDVTGYTIPPLSAYIVRDGSIGNSSRLVSAINYETGGYTLTFDRDVSHCRLLTSAYASDIDVDAGYAYQHPDEVVVNTRAINTDTLFSADFFITVDC